MRFRDIKPFTQTGSYEIHVSLIHMDRQINDFLEEGLELNPDFQRGHVWTEEQQVAFIEYLLRKGRSGMVVYLNHPLWQTGRMAEPGDFVCVDGLQRITACLRFVRNEIKAFGKYLSEYEDKPSDLVGLKFNINELQTREEVLTWYLESNSGGTVHSQEELNRVRVLLEEERQKSA